MSEENNDLRPIITIASGKWPTGSDASMWLMKEEGLSEKLSEELAAHFTAYINGEGLPSAVHTAQLRDLLRDSMITEAERDQMVVDRSTASAVDELHMELEVGRRVRVFLDRVDDAEVAEWYRYCVDSTIGLVDGGKLSEVLKLDEAFPEYSGGDFIATCILESFAHTTHPVPAQIEGELGKVRYANAGF